MDRSCTDQETRRNSHAGSQRFLPVAALSSDTLKTGLEEYNSFWSSDHCLNNSENHCTVGSSPRPSSWGPRRSGLDCCWGRWQRLKTLGNACLAENSCVVMMKRPSVLAETPAVA